MSKRKRHSSPEHNKETDDECSVVEDVKSEQFPNDDLKASLKCIEIDKHCVLMDFSMSGMILVNRANVLDLLQAARQFNFMQMANACIEFMTESLDSTHYFQFLDSIEPEMTDVQEQFDEYLRQHFVEICNSDGFIGISLDTLKTMLAKVDLNISSDEHLMRAVISWTKHDSVRKKELPELKLFIRRTQAREEFANGEIKDTIEKTCTVLVRTSTDVNVKYPEIAFREPNRAVENSNERTVLCYIAWNGKLHLKYWNVNKDIWMQWSYPINLGGARHPVLINVNKYLYVIGGFDALADKYIKAVKKVNILDLKIVATYALKTEKSRPNVIAVNGTLYVIGGNVVNTTLDDKRTMERYDLKDFSWIDTIPIPSYMGKTIIGATHVNGSIFIITDAISLRFDLISSQWDVIHPSYDVHGSKCQAVGSVAEFNGEIYVLGRLDDAFERFSIIHQEWEKIECYTPKGPNIFYSFQNALFSLKFRSRSEGKTAAYVFVFHKYHVESNSWTELSMVKDCGAEPLLFTHRFH